MIEAVSRDVEDRILGGIGRFAAVVAVGVGLIAFAIGPWSVSPDKPQPTSEESLIVIPPSSGVPERYWRPHTETRNGHLYVTEGKFVHSPACGCKD